MADEVVAHTVDMASGGDKKKSTNYKGAPHALHFEILDDPNIKAENNWETEEAEYWTSKICKQYVKMYHVDKFWPRDNHEMQTRAFACNKRTCKNADFVKRSEEVWTALFGAKKMSKGYINYSLSSMVYAELVLGKKVDWSTYPTTSKNPLLLEKNKKDIPGVVVKVEAQLEKVLLNTTMPTTKIEEGTSDVHKLVRLKTEPKVDEGREGEQVEEIFCTAPLRLEFTSNVSNNVATTKELDVAHDWGVVKRGKDVPLEDVAKANASIDRLIESNVLDSLEYVAPNDDVAEPSSPILSPKVQVHLDRGKGKVNDMTKPFSLVDAEDLGREHLNLNAFNENELKFFLNMPKAKELEELLETGNLWKSFDEKLPKSSTVNDVGSSNPVQRASELNDVASAALDLMVSAKLMGGMTPVLTEMAADFNNMVPHLVRGAKSFQNLLKYFKPILLELQKCEKEKIEMNAWLQEKHEVEMKFVEMEKLGTKWEKERKWFIQLARELYAANEELENALFKRGVPKKKGQKQLEYEAKYPPEAPIQESQDSLSLPCEKMKAVEEIRVVEVAQEINIEPPNPVLEIASTQNEGVHFQEMQRKLEEAMQEKALLQSELERLKRSMDLNRFQPQSGLESRWLAWVQQLQDRPSVASRALIALRKLAMNSDEEGKAIENSLEKFKGVFNEHPCADHTEITCWGDMDAMFERLNHTKKGENKPINWALEAEEGWVPHNTLSSHMKATEKLVVHACDPAPGIMSATCSLCVGPFGPEGALVMGQCRHTFHVTCIVKAALARSVCPECRSPISPRFYEMLGVLESMPPGHEYDRWTLPLDQGPYKFQNFLHWGKPLMWNVKEQIHGLHEESGQEVDSFLWMTKNREVELRARVIEDEEDREMFCRFHGGHWSKEHKKFFRFLNKEVQKGADGSWVEVEHDAEFKEQYKGYDHALIGRALLLSKLEEAAQIRALVKVDGETKTGHASVEVAQAFDRRMGDIIVQWKALLLEGEVPSKMKSKTADEVVKTLVEKVDVALKTLMEEEVDLTPLRKRKRKMEEDDEEFSPDSPTMKRRISEVDLEVQSGGRIMNDSQRRSTRASTKLLKVIKQEKLSPVKGEGSSAGRSARE